MPLLVWSALACPVGHGSTLSNQPAHSLGLTCLLSLLLGCHPSKGTVPMLGWLLAPLPAGANLLGWGGATFTHMAVALRGIWRAWLRGVGGRGGRGEAAMTELQA